MTEAPMSATYPNEVGRTVASLTRLEKAWCRRRFCGFCEAPLLGSCCYAYSGEYELPAIDGVRDTPEVVNLGPACDMDKRRAVALTHYRPRVALPPPPEPFPASSRYGFFDRAHADMTEATK